jgi:hypothetical protein
MQSHFETLDQTTKTKFAMKKWSRNHSNLQKIIGNCNYTLVLLDGIEEQRNLSIMEKIQKYTQKAYMQIT